MVSCIISLTKMFSAFIWMILLMCNPGLAWVISHLKLEPLHYIVSITPRAWTQSCIRAFIVRKQSLHFQTFSHEMPPYSAIKHQLLHLLAITKFSSEQLEITWEEVNVTNGILVIKGNYLWKVCSYCEDILWDNKFLCEFFCILVHNFVFIW